MCQCFPTFLPASASPITQGKLANKNHQQVHELNADIEKAGSKQNVPSVCDIPPFPSPTQVQFLGFWRKPRLDEMAKMKLEYDPLGYTNDKNKDECQNQPQHGCNNKLRDMDNEAEKEKEAYGVIGAWTTVGYNEEEEEEGERQRCPGAAPAKGRNNKGGRKSKASNNKEGCDVCAGFLTSSTGSPGAVTCPDLKGSTRPSTTTASTTSCPSTTTTVATTTQQPTTVTTRDRIIRIYICIDICTLAQTHLIRMALSFTFALHCLLHLHIVLTFFLCILYFAFVLCILQAHFV